MAKDTLPAVSEAEATGEIADLFADIRETLNVSAINYVWRHIATIDGGLRWAWEASKPLFISGLIEKECKHLMAELSFPKLAVVPENALSQIDVEQDDKVKIAAILDTYNRGNMMNMMSLSALLVEPKSVPAGERDSAKLPSTDVPLPPFPEVADLTENASEQVMVLNGFGAKAGPNRVVASIYKHVALWPGYLTLTWAQFIELHKDGSLLAMIEETKQKSHLHASYIAHELGPRPEGQVANNVKKAVTEFTDTAIARMIPIGQMMRQSLGN